MPLKVTASSEVSLPLPIVAVIEKSAVVSDPLIKIFTKILLSVFLISIEDLTERPLITRYWLWITCVVGLVEKVIRKERES